MPNKKSVNPKKRSMNKKLLPGQKKPIPNRYNFTPGKSRGTVNRRRPEDKLPSAKMTKSPNSPVTPSEKKAFSWVEQFGRSIKNKTGKVRKIKSSLNKKRIATKRR